MPQPQMPAMTNWRFEVDIEKIGPAAVRLAEAEGLQGHALSVAIRLNKGAA